MGMVIKNNLDSVRTYNIYNRNTIALSDAMYKVSSGQRINSAADGPSDLAISEKMRGRIRSTDQAGRNVQNGLNMIKTAEGALSNITDILNSMREKLMNAANDTNTAEERALIRSEYEALIDQIDENANVRYNGQHLLDGTWASGTNLYFQIGGEEGLNMSLNIEALNRTGLGLAFDFPDEFTSTAAGEAHSAAMGLITTIDMAITSALTQLTNLGNIEARLGFTADNLSTESENLQASESAIRDLDMAKGMTDFMKYNVLTQASQFMLAQAGQNAYSVMNLLQQ